MRREGEREEPNPAAAGDVVIIMIVILAAMQVQSDWPVCLWQHGCPWNRAWVDAVVDHPLRPGGHIRSVGRSFVISPGVGFVPGFSRKCPPARNNNRPCPCPQSGTESRRNASATSQVPQGTRDKGCGSKASHRPHRWLHLSSAAFCATGHTGSRTLASTQASPRAASQNRRGWRFQGAVNFHRPLGPSKGRSPALWGWLWTFRATSNPTWTRDCRRGYFQVWEMSGHLALRCGHNSSHPFSEMRWSHLRVQYRLATWRQFQCIGEAPFAYVNGQRNPVRR